MEKLPKLNVLLSHFYIRDTELMQVMEKFSPHMNILIDSGAFSDTNEAIKAAKTGKKYDRLTIEEYIAFCKKEYSRWAWGYINLDHPLSTPKSMQNYRVMLKAGTKPIPVAHSTVSKKMYREYVETSDGLICVGGIAGKSTGKNRKILAYALYSRLYKWGDNNVRLHALGFAKYPEINYLPLYSVDSTTWMNGYIYGEASIFTPNRMVRTTNLRPGHSDKLNTLQLAHLFDFAKKCGVEYEDWARQDMRRGVLNLRGYMTAFAYLRLHDYITREKNKRYFFVLTSKENFDKLFALLSSSEGEHFNFWHCIEEYKRLSSMKWAEAFGEMMKILSDKTEVTVEAIP